MHYVTDVSGHAQTRQVGLQLAAAGAQHPREQRLQTDRVPRAQGGRLQRASSRAHLSAAGVRTVPQESGWRPAHGLHEAQATRDHAGGVILVTEAGGEGRSIQCDHGDDFPRRNTILDGGYPAACLAVGCACVGVVPAGPDVGVKPLAGICKLPPDEKDCHGFECGYWSGRARSRHVP